MRKAFSMLTAVFIIILMATVSAFVVNISGQAVETTVLQYKKEQAVLYSKSYTELAIMAATANDSTAGTAPSCAQDIDGRIGTDVNNGIGYDIQTRISYIGNNLKCATTRELNNQAIPIVTDDALHIIIDVYVKYRDPAFIAAAGTATGAPWITYHRRTLQKL